MNNLLNLNCFAEKEKGMNHTAEGRGGLFGDLFDFCGPSRVGSIKVVNGDQNGDQAVKHSEYSEDRSRSSPDFKRQPQRPSRNFGAASPSPGPETASGSQMPVNPNLYPRLAGIGIAFETGENIGLIVHSFVPGGSAETFGSGGVIKPGDELIAVDGVDVRGKKGKELAQLLIGPEGTKVRVSFVRPCEGSHHRHEITVELIRRVPQEM